MKLKLVSLIFLMCFTFQINGQSLTKKEAINFAEKLHEVEILSEKGKEDLIKRIQRKKLKRLIVPNVFVTGKEYTSELSHAQLLSYCYEAFYNETAFRLGLTDYNKLSKKIIKTTTHKVPEEYRILDSIFNAKHDTFEGVIIEKQINSSHRESHHGIHYELKSPYKLTKLQGEYGLIHPNRSATGQHVDKTIQDLIKIGLIDTTQNQLRYCDWGIEYSSLHCLYMNRIEEEDKTIDEAKSKAFLEEIHKADIITKESLEQLIELDRQDKIYEKMNLYQYCKNGIVVDVDYNLSIDSFYQNLFHELKAIIPNFDYSNLKIIREQDKYHSYISLQFSINGIIYESGRVSCSRKRDLNQISIDDEFFKGIEQYLRDINSDKRLYYSKSIFREFKDNYGVGFILLTKNQNITFNEP